MNCSFRSRMVGSLCLGMMLIGAGWSRAAAQTTPDLDRRVDGATKSAIAFLKVQSANVSAGRDSLVAIALIKADVPKDSPEVRRLVEASAARVFDDTYHPANSHIRIYEGSVTLMALANADPVAYKPQITTLANFIIDDQGEDGDWDYHPARTTGDTSISQYAMLALWEANRAGVRIPSRVWDRAASWHISRQVQDGGFAYHPTVNASTGSLHSMTVAGIGSLCIARRHLYPDAVDTFKTEVVGRRSQRKFGVLEVIEVEDPDAVPEQSDRNYVPRIRLSQIDAAIERALRWMETRFTVTQPSGWPIYYLYGLERASALANQARYGDHDWYAEGARHLVDTQASNGTWSDQSEPPASTAFGLLFLMRATNKMLGRVREARFGKGLLAGGRGLPENLAEANVTNGKVQTRKLQGGLDELLAELENPRSEKVEQAQASLVENVLLNRAELVGQTDRLKKLAVDPRAEVRRTAMWALGRSGELRLAPLLIDGLRDADPDVWTEARNGLRVLSRRLAEFGQPDGELDDKARLGEHARWKTWYLSVRPYDERDDLPDGPRATRRLEKSPIPPRSQPKK